VTAHPSDAELRKFAAGVLPPDEILRIDDHLSQCDRCRRAAADVTDASARIREFRTQLGEAATLHVSDEELVLLVEDRLPPAAREAAMRHLDECATCAAHAGDLREWTRTPPRFRWSRLAVAAVVAFTVLVPTAIWQWRTLRPPAVAPSLAGLDAISADERVRVQAALDRGAARLPAFIGDVVASREVLMGRGGAGSGMFTVVAPVGTGTVSDRPAFRWRALEHADGYDVAVFDERANAVARSPRLSTAEWTPADPLPRGRTYVWQVYAHRGGETITAPAAPSPAARFRVIDANAAAIVERLEADHPQSHLLLGILFMEYGVVDAAVAHLRQVPSTDPHAAVAARSLDAIAAATTERSR
jgi:hypothetical protein